MNPIEYQINGKTYVLVHGNPFDRGVADSYYHRPRDPHCWPTGTYNGQRIEAADMTEEMIEAYHAGYDHNEQFGDKKVW
jgi:hypothetical protein